jgi:hypothetical protein
MFLSHCLGKQMCLTTVTQGGRARGGQMPNWGYLSKYFVCLLGFLQFGGATQAASPVDAPAKYASIEALRDVVIAKFLQSSIVVKALPDANDPANIIATMRSDNGDELLVHTYVGNLFGRLNVLGSPNADEEIQTFVNVALGVATSHKVNPSRIYANVRHKDMVKTFDPKHFIFSDLPGDLIIFYQLEVENGYAGLDHNEIGSRTLEQLRDLARENIERELAGLHTTSVSKSAEFYSLDDCPALTPALLLSDKFWNILNKRFPNGAYVIAPRRDQVFAYDKSSPAALSDAKKMIAATAADGVDLLSEHVFERVNGNLALVQ